MMKQFGYFVLMGLCLALPPKIFLFLIGLLVYGILY